jgi:hypothetical protein
VRLIADGGGAALAKLRWGEACKRTGGDLLPPWAQASSGEKISSPPDVP